MLHFQMLITCTFKSWISRWNLFLFSNEISSLLLSETPHARDNYVFLQKLNQVVLWDKIIERGDNAVLKYKNLNSEYYFFDDGSGLK